MDEEAGWGSTAGNGGTGSKSRYLAGSRRSRGGTGCSRLAMTGTSSVDCSDVSMEASKEGCGGVEGSCISVH